MYSTQKTKWGDWYVCKNGAPSERYASEAEADERIKRLLKARSLKREKATTAAEPKRKRGRPRKVQP